MRAYLSLLACICIGWTVQAQDTLQTVILDDVVISGTKTETPIEKSGKTIFKIGAETLQSSLGKSVADILNEVPGLQIGGNFGALGTNIDYSVRGGANRQTLILIDGVPFNDPSGISQTFDLRLLDLDQIESIEILKGGLSTLYGTGAAAGVINITLKKPEQQTLAGKVGFEYGSFNTWRPLLSLGGTRDQWKYSFNGSYRKSDGFSAANDARDTGSFDKDGFESYNLLGKVGYTFSSRFLTDLTLAIDDYETGYDSGPFLDGNNFLNSKQTRIGLSPSYNWSGGHIKGSVFYATIKRQFDIPDFFNPAERFLDEYDGNNLQVDAVLDQNISPSIKLIGGLNYQSQSYSQPEVAETSFSIFDPYLTLNHDQSNLNIQLGGRLNSHSDYGTNFVYNINPTYLIDLGGQTGLKLLASYSTSFITPSLFQLQSPAFGNPNLNPESSENMEGGLSLYADKLSFDLAYFYRKDKDQIGFQSQFDTEGNFIGGTYFNQQGELATDGVEFSMKHEVVEKLTLSGHYTYLRRLNDGPFFRLPENKYGFSAQYRPLPTWSLSMRHLHIGETMEDTFPESTTISAYDLLDFTFSKQFERLKVSGAINNLLDESYQSLLGFNTRDRNYTIRLSYQF